MRILLPLSAVFLVSWAAAQTQNLPEPGQANTLITGNQCAGQDEASMGFQLLHTSGSRNTFESNFTQWISGNTSNTALPTNWTYRNEDSSIYASGGTPDIRSERTFQNFEWRLSYRNSGNDGLFYKMLTRGSAAWSVGVEFGIDNNTSQANRKITAGASGASEAVCRAIFERSSIHCASASTSGAALPAARRSLTHFCIAAINCSASGRELWNNCMYAFFASSTRLSPRYASPRYSIASP
jgi:hypothetical protein